MTSSQEQRPNVRGTSSDPSRELMELRSDITQLIEARSEVLVKSGFLPEMARFDCIAVLKKIVDDLYGEMNVGSARLEWYHRNLWF